MSSPNQARALSTASPAIKRPKRLPKTEVQRVATPIVKWVGGKKRLLGELSQRVPESFERYIEPFAGGAALFYRLAPKRAILSDFNEDLINTYDSIAWNVESVIRRLAHHQRKHGEEHYYKSRTRWNARPSRDTNIDRAALFIYLNKTCFNGLWRVNRKGQYNVPMGRYERPSILDHDGLRAASPLLRRAELMSGDYSKAAKSARKGDFVYFDPPYHPVTKTSNFTSYTKLSFGEDQQAELADVAKHLASTGVKVLLSNSDTPLIRKLFKGAQIDTVRCSRAINSNASKRGGVNEVMIRLGY